MRKRNRYYFHKVLPLIVWVSTTAISIKAQVVDWPFPAPNTNYKVTGTIGEYRDVTRFHGGVDLKNGSNYTVNSINAGNTYVYVAPATPNTTSSGNAWQSFIIVGDVKYYHVKKTVTTFPSNVSAGAYLGVMFTNNPSSSNPSPPYHVHVETCTMQNTSRTAFYNYLNNRISPFYDNVAPELWNYSTSEFTKNSGSNTSPIQFRFNKKGTKGNNATFATDLFVPISPSVFPVVFGKVDMIVRARDKQVLNAATSGSTGGGDGGGDCAPNSLTFEILHSGSAIPIDGKFTSPTKINWINFDSLPDQGAGKNVMLVGSTSGTHIYIITHFPKPNQYWGPTPFTVTDRYWNTKLMRGEVEDWMPANGYVGNIARCNEEALAPDGTYQIEVEAKDLKNNSVKRTATAVVDNFIPYVKMVEMYNGSPDPGNKIYSAYWEWQKAGSLVFHKDEIGGGANSTSDLVVQVTFSEPMYEANIKSPDIGLASGVPMNIVSGDTTKTKWTYSINHSYINPLTICHKYKLEITGKDLAGNSVQGYQSTNNIPYTSISSRKDDGTWQPPLPSSPVSDIIHGFHKNTYKDFQVVSPVYNSNHSFSCIEVDGLHKVWAGVDSTSNDGGGIMMFDPSSQTWASSLPTARINSIKRDAFGKVWVASSGSSGQQAVTGGVCRFSAGNISTYIRWGYLAFPGMYLSSRFVHDVEPTSTGGCIAASALTFSSAAHQALNGALDSYIDDHQWNKLVGGGTYFNFNTSSFTAGNTLFYEVAMVNGNIWASGADIPQGGTTSRFINVYGPNGLLQSTYPTGTFLCRSLYKDSRNDVWAGLNNADIQRFHNGSWQVMSSSLVVHGQISSVNPHAINGDSYGNIFIGTTSGLLVYEHGPPNNPSNGFDVDSNWLLFTTANGLPSNNVKGIAIDSSGYLWIATAAGVVRAHYEGCPSSASNLAFPHGSAREMRVSTTEMDKNMVNIYPNPFGESTTIEFNMPQISNVACRVYDLLGKEIVTLLNEERESGQQVINWNGNDKDNKPASSGVYYIQIVFDNVSVSKKVIIQR